MSEFKEPELQGEKEPLSKQEVKDFVEKVWFDDGIVKSPLLTTSELGSAQDAVRVVRSVREAITMCAACQSDTKNLFNFHPEDDSLRRLTNDSLLRRMSKEDFKTAENWFKAKEIELIDSLPDEILEEHIERQEDGRSGIAPLDQLKRILTKRRSEKRQKEEIKKPETKKNAEKDWRPKV